ncbi:ATP-grasp domain-containing protein [Streptomyces sp. RKND-216]|uniref:ATP-binding protein n=1 Tax=Streptomyces sp. RKND-216 TaxID=2562581 RepID=UPI00109D8D29|nr:biotin carboxylase N-terminal domain-containing protein [Streptomyces sp. RKND-216]THA25864.1 ATP-grasp domain-containing protein [Streptomyces sp. RKND-216]
MTAEITSVLVANRGEIARRVFRTCRERGLATVAVYGDPDADAPHVREADAAVRLPGDAPADTYLRGDLLVKAALAAGADAVHPGYGFLSENACFARAVRDAGLVWIGPPPEAIEAMASKTRAKRVMAEAGVPLLAALRAEDATPEDLPLLVKAAAGGGGRGMRVVRELGALDGEIRAASAEAASAFGDGEVFVEPYVERGRHVEVQVLADAHGRVWVLGTRDCSLQRRHQKVIEEAPAPGLSEETRDALHRAAEAAARAVAYEGAGTVEFLVADDGRAYFLEMNTRLQVEHPVTECVYGLDLVALQLHVAEGAPLPEGGPPVPRGHAVEVRLYAEDPARGWQPQTGRLHRLHVPGALPFGGRGRDGEGRDGEGTGGPSAGSGAGLRLDAGFGDGDPVTVHYDPMLAKAVAWAPTRREAVRRLAGALERARVHGPVTNRDLLVRSLRHPDFAAGRVDTGFYDRHLPDLVAAGDDPRAARLAALAAALADAAARTVAPGAGTAARMGGWRNVPSRPHRKAYRAFPAPGGGDGDGGDPDGGDLEIRYHWSGGRPAPPAEDFPGVRVTRPPTPECVVLEADGVERAFDVARYDDGQVCVDASPGAWTFTTRPAFPDPEDRTEPGSLLAETPGTVVRLAEGVEVGAEVAAGQALLWLEAMKMEHRVAAPAAGILLSLPVAPGDQVQPGTTLAVVTPPETAQ